MTKSKNTSETILDIAQSLVQEFGFNGFSYAHIADKVGVKTASIHYHFPNKEDLGEALIVRYLQRFVAATAHLDSVTKNSKEKLRKYTLLYSEPVQDFCTCLSVMLASDVATLPEKMREGLARFFEANLTWLERVLDEGRREGDLHFEGASHLRAHQILASFQGGQLLARSFRDPGKFHRIAEEALFALS
ncbi:TetR/AcrR family transcriptional regulator [Paenibacillus glycanilyticus]|uniref:TetR/AcrR family transcriptional regulator n=1 Tax=Paenibacillus glycanilyticus TaxID=126569 RepID=UPI00203B14C3|nr:TetR/AcrR family transcriptional regulator [Paenibacillus glycanilyticus]MCM3628333.1 TetR/AcrR family transcriptional regulator [Paenibacillus glycanilyticus]